MRLTFPTALARLAMALAATALAGSALAVSAQTPAKPREQAQPREQARPRDPIKLDTIYQLCAMRQREILAHNRSVMEASLRFAAAKDQAARESSRKSIELFKQAATTAEISWERLSCFEILYRTPQAASGR